MHALVKSRSEHVLRRDDVERLEAWQPGQHVVIGGPQAARVSCLIRDAHHDSRIRWRPSVRQQHPSQRMFVQTPARFDERLESAEGLGQELGLSEQPLGAAIDLDACLEAVGHQAVEIGDLFVAAPELVVERQDLDDEAGTKFEGRGSAAGNCGRGRACQEDFAFERREHRGRQWEPFVQAGRRNPRG